MADDVHTPADMKAHADTYGGMIGWLKSGGGGLLPSRLPRHLPDLVTTA
ncbi:hypothetical protein AB5I41_18815 [Sphingomonas sp. MMS24-JH45]